ncbi:MAG: hypothetical protein ABIP48_15175 [Planctomycetota bacterium]
MPSSFQTAGKWLLITIGSAAGGCGSDPPGIQESGSVPDQHPHTKAMLNMVAAMECAGYHPSTAEHRNKSFAEDPIVWLGPWHIDVPNDDPFQVEWRLTIYRRGRAEQPHSFVSAEYDGRFSGRLLTVVVDEWKRMGAVGLPQTVVDRGRRLLDQAEKQYARKRREQSISSYTLNEEGSQTEHYILRVEFHDHEGFADGEGVVRPFARAILFFTLLQSQ